MRKNIREKPLVIIQCYEDRQPTLPISKRNSIKTNGEIPTVTKDTEKPPPPPPMPMSNGATNGCIKSTNNYKIDKDQTDNYKNEITKRIPTPDYSNKITTTVNSKKSIKEEAAELESLESFKLKNPSSVQPKPPSNYFVRAPNGTATMKKHVRPVSVTIGEYPSGGLRKEPSKLDFIANEKANGVNGTDTIPISNRLQSELALTLSRSNLRKKTDSIIDAGR